MLPVWGSGYTTFVLFFFLNVLLLEYNCRCVYPTFVKMYKDKEVKKNVKDIFLPMCDVKIFLTFTSPNMVLP